MTGRDGTKLTPYLKVGVYSLLVNMGLVAVKLTLSLLTGSLALRADAIHSSVDIFASVALITGLVIANRKSARFPYGLYKVENVVAVAISALLFITSYEIVLQAIGAETVPAVSGWVLVAAGALIIVPYLFSRYETSAGVKYNSPALIADGKQFTADVFSASVVLLALAGQFFRIPLDRIAAGVVALFIVRAGWDLLSNGMRVLLDASVDNETLARIRSVLEAEPGVTAVKSLTGRNSGRYIFVEATVAVRVTDLKRAHLISERLEKRVREKEPRIDRVLIHYEPETKTQQRYAVALSNREGLLSEDFGISPYFALVDTDTEQKTVVRQEIVANPYREAQKGRGIKIAEFLLPYKPDVVIARESLAGKGPGYALDDAGVEIRQTQAKSLDELLNQVIAGQSEK